MRAAMVATFMTAALVSAQDMRVGYDRWASWIGFSEGASVTFETQVEGKAYRRVVTLKEKSKDSFTLDVVQESPPDRSASSVRTVPSTEKGETRKHYDEKCKICGGHKRGAVKEGTEKVKVGEGEVECTWIEVAVVDCNGNRQQINRTWFSKAVPGGIVKFEDVVFKSGEERPFAVSTYTCVAFDTKSKK